MWKVANSARQEMRPRGTGDQAGNSRRGKMKGKYPYRTKHPNFSHQLEHVGPTKQISEVQAHRICYLAPLQAPCAKNRKEWQDLHKLVAKKHRENRKTLPFKILFGCQYVKVVFKASALWADAFSKSICQYVCVRVCSSVMSNIRYFSHTSHAFQFSS